MAQPTLSFQSQRPAPPSSKGTKPKLAAPAPPRTPSPISETENENAPEKPKETPRKRRRLDVGSARWAGLVKSAKVQMGGMKPIHAGTETHNDLHRESHGVEISPLTTFGTPFLGTQEWPIAER